MSFYIPVKVTLDIAGVPGIIQGNLIAPSLVRIIDIKKKKSLLAIVISIALSCIGMSSLLIVL